MIQYLHDPSGVALPKESLRIKNIKRCWKKVKSYTNKSLMEKYQPIACQFYDVLELKASRREKCTIAYFETSKSVRTVETIIEDIYTGKDKGEYLRLSDESIVRLDQIISLDDTQFYGACAF